MQKSTSVQTIGSIESYSKDMVKLFGENATIENAKIESIRDMSDLKFTTGFNDTKPLIKYWKTKRKPLQIIFIGSRPGIQADLGVDLVAYSLVNSLLFKLTDYINFDTRSTNIIASIIVPSTLDTRDTRAPNSEVDRSLWVPIGSVANTTSIIFSNTVKIMGILFINCIIIPHQIQIIFSLI